MAVLNMGGVTLLRPWAQSFVTYDLEFIDDGKTIDLVSIGMVSGDGRELYAVNREIHADKLLNHDNGWMRKNVWPHLPLTDLPEIREGWDGKTHPVKTCPCKPVEGTRDTYSCQHMNGRLNKDHPDVRSMGQIRWMVSEFLMQCHPMGDAERVINRDDVKMWAYYGAYDHVRLAQIWGPMSDLPAHIPMLTHDLKSESMRLGDPAPPKREGVEHNALADARYNLKMARHLWELATGKKKEN